MLLGVVNETVLGVVNQFLASCFCSHLHLRGSDGTLFDPMTLTGPSDVGLCPSSDPGMLLSALALLCPTVSCFVSVWICPFLSCLSEDRTD